ncbi:MAG: hypothetical protein WD696_16095 [Bryobacteraceae bacterium]
MTRRRRLALVVVYAHFLALAADGLWSYFTPDDMMNLYGYWSKPLSRLLLDGLPLFSSGYRPAGALFYVPVFHVFGFDPLPFRVVCFLLLALNLYLNFAFVHRLTGSSAAAIVSALLFSYHAHFADLYYSSGAVYDLLAFVFFYSCLLLYVGIRQTERVPTAWQHACLCVLFWLALNSKEISAMLPVVLLAYECCYKNAVRAMRKSCLRWAVGPGRCILTFGLLGGAHMLPRLLGGGSMASNPAYRPELSLGAYLENLRHYLGLLLYCHEGMTGFAAASIVIAMPLLALLLKNGNLVFSWLLFVIVSLPVMFIAARGAFVLYLPYLGMTMYAGVVFAAAARPVFETLRRRTAVALGTLGAAALVLYNVHDGGKPQATGWVRPEQAKVREVADRVSGRYKTLGKGVRVLLINSPFPDDDYGPLFILRLYYLDRSLQVKWLKQKGSLSPEALAQYDHVFEFPEARAR